MSGDARSLRILLVEDHEDSRVLLERLLKRNGHEVCPAASVTEALTVAEGHRCDLLISDIGLPDGTGVDLLHRLCKLYPVPGIAITGHGEERYAQDCTKAGFKQHLMKPVSFSELMAAVDAAMRPA